jgi:hypothetical protein
LALTGFKVVIDNHVWLEDPTAYENTPAWIEGWTRLAKAVSKVGMEHVCAIRTN